MKTPPKPETATSVVESPAGKPPLRRLGGTPAVSPDTSRTIDAAGAALARAQSNFGELVFENVKISQVDPDPENPRNFPWIDHRNPAATVLRDDQEKERAEFEALKALGKSMRTQGQRTPMEVFEKDNRRMQIVAGHRRYWAARIEGLTEVLVRFVKEAKHRNKGSQWVENNVRSELPLSGRLESFRQAVTAYEAAGESEEAIEAMIGLKNRSFRRYKALLNAPDDIKQAISDSLIDNAKVAERLASIKDPAARTEALNAALAGSSPETSAATKKEAGKAPSPKGGRPVTTVKTRPIRETMVVRTIMEKVGNGAVPEIDWGNPAAVAKAWQSFLDELEKQFKGKK